MPSSFSINTNKQVSFSEKNVEVNQRNYAQKTKLKTDSRFESRKEVPYSVQKEVKEHDATKKSRWPRSETNELHVQHIAVLCVAHGINCR